MTSDQGSNADPLLQGPFAARRAGLLLHPTSLPSTPGNGDLGPDAFRFVDFLAECGFTVWQMLPLGPTHSDESPYQCTSVHAGNYRLISLERLSEAGWLDKVPPILEGDAPQQRRNLLRVAYAGFRQRGNENEQQRFEQFCKDHAFWLDNFALYQALRDEYGGRSWVDWAPEVRDRDPIALVQHTRRLAAQIAQVRFEQFVFFEQWRALRGYARERGVLLFGDIPIFVAHDSAEVWANRDCFVLDESGHPEVVAGVPPDYFSATGQRWGNPHYRWDALEKDNYRWWIDRLRTQIELFDLLRVDHFRGFEAYWEISAGAETAVDGRWIKTPGEALFCGIREQLGSLPLVAEDLGVITPEVEALRDRFGLPGMKILQFAFGGDASNPYLPHNHRPLCIVYTGTHDNDTTLGWYQTLSRQEKHHLREYLGSPREKMPWPMIRMAFASVVRMAVIPLQDVLELGSEHRMNRPGVQDGNWRWRFAWAQLADNLPKHLRHMLEIYGRSG